MSYKTTYPIYQMQPSSTVSPHPQLSYKDQLSLTNPRNALQHGERASCTQHVTMEDSGTPTDAQLIAEEPKNSSPLSILALKIIN